MRIGEIASAGAAAVAATAAIYLFTLVRGGDHARYEVSELALAAAFLIPLGWWMIVRGPSPVSGGLAFAATALLLTGSFTLFSGAGMLILPLGLVAAVLAVRSIRWHSRGDIASTIGGIVASVGLSLVVLALLSPPLVECAGPHARVALPLGARMSTTVTSDERRESGEIMINGRTHRYVCEQGRLVAFSTE